MADLDKIDIKLLAILEEDGRQSLSQIAKKLNTSQQVVSYRIKSLEKRNIIGGYYTFINFLRLGYTSFRTMISFSNINKTKHKEIISFLMDHPNVLWLVDCSGRWDLIINFLAKNIIQYESMFNEFRKMFPDQIQNYDILPTVEVSYFGRDYIMKKHRDLRKSSLLGKEYGTDSLDLLNYNILKMISKNARIPAVEIANKLKVSPNTVILRLNELKRTGMIQGYTTLLHLDYTGYSSYKALIKIFNTTEEKENAIINNLRSNVNVVGFVKLVGSWNFEIEFEVETNEQMIELTRDIRDRFRDNIKEFEIIQLLHEYKYDFFPGDLLEDNPKKSNKK